MTPAGVAGGESLVEIGSLGVHFRLTLPADDNVAKQRHPSPRMEHVMRSAPANGRVDPVPRRRGHQDIEAPSAVVPLNTRLRSRRSGSVTAPTYRPLQDGGLGQVGAGFALPGEDDAGERLA